MYLLRHEVLIALFVLATHQRQLYRMIHSKEYNETCIADITLHVCFDKRRK